MSAALGLTLTHRIAAQEIQLHIRVFPEIVRLTVRDNPEIYTMFNDDGRNPPTPGAIATLRQFFSVGNVFRVKAWDTHSTVLWSDQTDLIGKSFPDDDELRTALTGVENYELGAANKQENIDEKDRGITLQVYTPIEVNGTIVGAIELYEANRDLFSAIARNTRYIWSLVILAGLILYASLFGIFFRSYRRQRLSTKQISETQDVTILALAYQAELRDRQTGRHLERTSVYVRMLAEDIAGHEKYRRYLTPEYIEDLVKSAPLHDIGKVGVADSILLKPGKLTAEEFKQMQQHCEFGAQVLERAAERLGFQSFLTIALQLTRYHHEKWNGTGYPRGVAGDEIPISARIMALADNYDALRSPRPYKDSFSHATSAQIIAEGRGIHFDPELVDAFLRREKTFETISEQLADG